MAMAQRVTPAAAETATVVLGTAAVAVAAAALAAAAVVVVVVTVGVIRMEYPNCTPLLVKILEGLLSRDYNCGKASYHHEVINAANEVISSIDKDELAKYFSEKSEPEDEEGMKLKKKMEATRDQLVEALYRKGLALLSLQVSI
ncbi:Tripeptidyl-peptidase 2 [Nymphaea thermarum]|nr:Tripeptidyl-peptidase 2 [Nymphaea thermarum]